MNLKNKKFSFFTEILLDEANVALVPGSAFGADKYLRLSYTTSMENISKELQRIEGVINKFKDEKERSNNSYYTFH